MRLIYIGDISKQDALVLYKYASKATKVIEFGSGASTQVLAHTDAKIISLETEQSWVEITKTNLSDLGLKGIEFVDWGMRHTVMSGVYDVAFDDGHPPLRKQFFNEIFGLLRVGGVLLAHDTRCPSNWLYEAIHDHQNEITSVVINEDDSNITVVTKGEPKPYRNWHIDEDRDFWEFAQPNSVRPAGWREILVRKAPEVPPIQI